MHGDVQINHRVLSPLAPFLPNGSNGIRVDDRRRFKIKFKPHQQRYQQRAITVSSAKAKVRYFPKFTQQTERKNYSFLGAFKQFL